MSIAQGPLEKELIKFPKTTVTYPKKRHLLLRGIDNDLFILKINLALDSKHTEEVRLMSDVWKECVGENPDTNS